MYTVFTAFLNTTKDITMSAVSMTIRVEDSLKQAFSEASQSCDRSCSQLIRDFMRSYVEEQKSKSEYDQWYVEQVRIGIAAADAGEYSSSADVQARSAARRAALIARIEQ